MSTLRAFEPRETHILEVSDVFHRDAREQLMMAMSRAGMAKPLEDSNEHVIILFGFFECGPRDNEGINKPIVMCQRFLCIS